jgi:hypothetical protein
MGSEEMTTPAKRIKELRSRQLYIGSSMAVKLIAVEGYFHYQVLLTIDTKETKVAPWVETWKMNLKRNNIGGQKLPVIETYGKKDFVQASISTKYNVIEGKYNGEDPQDLIDKAEKIVGKWKLGKQVRPPMEMNA